MIDFQTLQDLSGGAAEVDSTCPLCSANRKSFNRKKKVLRIWNKEPGFATYNCTHCSAAGSARDEANGYTNGHAPNESEDHVAKAVMAAIGKTAAPQVLVKTYDYFDADGTLLYQKARYIPKFFTWRRPDGNGGWIKERGDRIVPYRLPDLLQYPDGTIFLCEGEKDGDRVASLGYCATNVGQKDLEQETCAAYFAGRDVIILKDNDDTGLERATTSATALHGKAKTIRIVGMPDGAKDVSEWLDLDPDNAGKFEQLCFDAPVLEKPPDLPVQSAAKIEKPLVQTIPAANVAVILRTEQPNWRNYLILTPTKMPKPLLANALTALREAPEWQGVLAYDEFALVTMLMKPPPWRKREDNSWTPTQWTDRDDVLTTDWLQHEGISINTKVTADVVEAVAKDNSYHPVRDYLNNLEWDGTKRIESFASCYLGAADTAYHQAVSRGMFVSSVARIMQPGCKVDTVPVLEGPQGKGKSTAIQLLFEPWFSDEIAELGTKDAAMQIRSAWCIELGELSSMTRADIEKVKAFITRKVDRFRPSYGRRVIEVKRQTILIGSTNLDTYLKDETGGRRYWPILCEGELKLEDIKRDKNQLWAEAISAFKAGTPWWLTGNLAAEAEEQQDNRYTDDVWQASIAGFVRLLPDTNIDDCLMSLGIEKSQWDQAKQNRVARCLKKMGWKRYRTPRPEREWRYRRPGPTSGTSLDF